MKRCSACGDEKPPADFGRCANNPDGLEYRCRQCHRQYHRDYAVKNHVKLLVKKGAWKAANKERFPEYDAKWRAKDPEKARALAAARTNAYTARNREAINAKKRAYSKANLEKRCAANARRYAQKIGATPAWANQFFIEEAYALAKMRTAMFGFEWQVDHIVPLKNKRVCGLHVENNLQVIPAVENQRKHNKFEVV